MREIDPETTLVSLAAEVRNGDMIKAQFQAQHSRATERRRSGVCYG